MKRNGEALVVVLCMLVLMPAVAGVAAFLSYCAGWDAGRQDGRIDIASGRVVGVRVPNADGLNEWRWKEANQ